MSGQYRVILADPPWQYRAFTPGTKTKRIGRVNVSPVAVQYDTLTVPQLGALPVSDLAEEDAALFLWATPPCLVEAIDLIRAWGFTYRTVAFNWVKLTRSGKPCIGLGHYTRANAEMCLLGIRGAMPVKDRAVRQVILSSRREHSRKPDEQYERIMRLFDGPYLELFARQQWPGWDVWGDQAGKFPAQPFLFGEVAS